MLIMSYILDINNRDTSNFKYSHGDMVTYIKIKPYIWSFADPDIYMVICRS